MQSEGVSPDIITFGVLAIGCSTHERGIHLIETARNFGIRLPMPFHTIKLLRWKLSFLIKYNFLTLFRNKVSFEVKDEMIFKLNAKNCVSRLNSEILGALLSRAGDISDFKYVKTILNAAKEDQTTLSPRFLAQLSKIVKKEKALRKSKEIDDEEKTCLSSSENLTNK